MIKALFGAGIVVLLFLGACALELGGEHLEKARQLREIERAKLPWSGPKADAYAARVNGFRLWGLAFMVAAIVLATRL